MGAQVRPHAYIHTHTLLHFPCVKNMSEQTPQASVVQFFHEMFRPIIKYDPYLNLYTSCSNPAPPQNCLAASITTLTLFKCRLCWGIRNPFKAKSSLSESIF